MYIPPSICGFSVGFVAGIAALIVVALIVTRGDEEDNQK